MIPDWLKRSAGGLFVVLIFTGGARPPMKKLPSFINAPHQKNFQKRVKREADFRLMTDEDCGQCADNLANQRRLSGADYHPYYVVGDFNGDGKEDFAVALIEIEADAEGRATQKFVVAVFNAPFSSRRIEPAFFKDNLNL